jgi:flagellar basal body-associated protein FliL
MNNKDKKGLSTIVATLLIILLTLVAVGIIWVVVKNVIQGGTDQLEIDSKCLQSNVIATSVVNVTPLAAVTSYNVTLTRDSGSEEIGGVSVVFTDEEETTSVIVDVPASVYSLNLLESRVVTASDVAVLNANKVSVVIYFLDSSGDKNYCSTYNDFEF